MSIFPLYHYLICTKPMPRNKSPLNVWSETSLFLSPETVHCDDLK